MCPMCLCVLKKNQFDHINFYLMLATKLIFIAAKNSF